MCLPLFFPFVITLSVAGIALLASGAFAPAFGKTRWQGIRLILPLIVIAFIPSCFGVMKVVHHFQYGRFNFANWNEVRDYSIRDWLPKSAIDIEVDSYPQGFRARYIVSKRDLDQWFDDYWNKYGEYSAIERVPVEQGDPDWLDIDFKELDWPKLPDVLLYEGPTADNGAGFTIWFSESQEIVYEQAGYW
jgi:hypothetical protein